MSAPLHIVVLMGGWSAEREVSLSSGKGVADALESRGHHVTRIDMGRDVAERLAEAKPDLVFNALHGTPGEDGSIQGLMDNARKNANEVRSSLQSTVDNYSGGDAGAALKKAQAYEQRRQREEEEKQAMRLEEHRRKKMLRNKNGV